jgi:hypothetical protein
MYRLRLRGILTGIRLCSCSTTNSATLAPKLRHMGHVSCRSIHSHVSPRSGSHAHILASVSFSQTDQLLSMLLEHGTLTDLLLVYCSTQHFPSFNPQAALSSPPPAPLETYDFNFPALFPGFSSDVSMDGVLNLDALGNGNNASFAGPTTIVAPIPSQATRQVPSPPPSTSRSPSSTGQSPSASGSPQPFLRRDNERLRADNAALQDEVAMLRRKHGRTQGQLDELRGQLRPLNKTLQEMLYLPGTQENEDERVVNVNQLFSILERISGFKRVLNSCQEE